MEEAGAWENRAKNPRTIVRISHPACPLFRRPTPTRSCCFKERGNEIINALAQEKRDEVLLMTPWNVG